MRICLARLSTIFHDRNVSQVEPFFCRPLAAIIVTLLTVGAASGQTDPLDWPYWRGPESNGISRETGLPETFNPKGGAGSMVAWEQPALGSRSTPVVLNGRLYTICRAEPGTAREGEKVVCADAKTGEILWENRFNVYLSDVPAERVGWSAVVGDPETGKVYVLGVCGLFSCIDGETGKTLWSVPLHERFGLLSTYGGRTNYPVICEDLVIVSAVVIGWGENARPCHQFIGLNKETGDVVWFNGTQLLPDDTTYSAPVVTVLNGQKAMVFGSGDGAVWAFQPRTGRHIWRYQFSQRGLNVSPTIDGDTVYMGQSEENVTGTTMGAVVAIDGNSEGDISDSGATWKVERLMVGKSSPLLVGDRLYVVEDSAKLHVLDPKTGDTLAKRIALGTMMRSNLLYADGKIYATEANGRWYIMKPDEKKGVQFLAKGRLPAGEECHGSPICSHGRVYFPSTGNLYCLTDDSRQHGSDPRPEPAAEKPATDRQPAFVQVVPADVLMKPGEDQNFSVRLFNAAGQLLGPGDATFTVQGDGAIDPDGTFHAVKDDKHRAVTVTAQVGKLKGTAKIRIVPPLPWKFDFEDIAISPQTKTGEPPITWIGARYRHVIREVDGNKVMVKITTIPKGTRSRAWFGPSGMSNYTIQADVRGSMTDGKLPDIGLIAQGYALDLQGAKQQLEIRSWDPQLRMAQSVTQDWQPDKWYTLKLQASTEGDKVRLRGKIWVRGEAEPETWTVEAVDTAPVLQGSPGLYGNAKDAELFLDNIIISEN